MADKNFAIKYTQDFLRACNQLKFPVDRVILFGSYATDKFTDDSDIDIAVFSNLFSDNPISNVDLIANAWIQFPLLDIKTFHTSDFERDSLILEEVKKNGIEINILN